MGVEVATSKTLCDCGGGKLFIDEYKIPYGSIPIDDHLEVFAIDSRSFKDWCRMKIYEHEGKVMDNQT